MISPIVYVVDDDDAVRNALDMQIEAAGFCVETFSSCTDFLAMLPSNASGCLLLDVRMPDMTGPQLQIEMTKRGIKLPIIFISGYGNIALAVETVQAGAIDFLTKQVNAQQLFSRIQQH